jgi:hypothetical protein
VQTLGGDGGFEGLGDAGGASGGIEGRAAVAPVEE